MVLKYNNRIEGEIPINALATSAPSYNRKWDKKKLRLLIDKSSKIELRLKSSHGVNKSTLIKNFMVEICNLANT